MFFSDYFRSLFSESWIHRYIFQWVADNIVDIRKWGFVPRRCENCRDMEIDSVFDWLELEEDALELIATKLTVLADFVRFGAVCKKWRSIFLENRHRIPHQLPVLIIPTHDGEKGDFRGFFSLSEKKTYPLKMLPDANNEKWCRGSSDGYLIMVDLRLNISLFNPFSRTETHLPRLTNPPRIISVSEMETGTIMYTYQSWFPGHPPRVETAEHMREHYVSKVITAGPYVIAILAFNSVLAFCRRDSGTWTYVEKDSFCFEDVVCYNGKFYATSDSGCVGVLDVSEPHPTLMVVVDVIIEEDGLISQKYLVESSGQLLMVARKMDSINFEYPPHRTTSFWIFRLDVNRHLFFPLKTLGDGMLFLGENCLMSLSARDFSGCKGNHIYFTDDQEWYAMDACRGYDLRVYNVEDGSIEPYYKMDSKWLWPWPIWLTPKPW